MRRRCSGRAHASPALACSWRFPPCWPAAFWTAPAGGSRTHPRPGSRPRSEDAAAQAPAPGRAGPPGCGKSRACPRTAIRHRSSPVAARRCVASRSRTASWAEDPRRSAALPGSRDPTGVRSQTSAHGEGHRRRGRQARGGTQAPHAPAEDDRLAGGHRTRRGGSACGAGTPELTASHPCHRPTVRRLERDRDADSRYELEAVLRRRPGGRPARADRS